MPYPPGFRSGRPARRGGFTLIEVLVTIGIITLLAGIAVPALVSARKSAKRTAIMNQLQMIYTGLDQYRHEFNDSYPQVDLSSGPQTPYGIGDNGAFTLCRALFAPAPAMANDPTTEMFDGKDGPGFRKVQGGGKVFGPYLVPDNFRFAYAMSDGGGGYSLSPVGTNFTAKDYGKLMIIDQTGKPILYCPAITARPRFGNTNPSAPKVYFADRRSSKLANEIVYFDLDRLLGSPAVTTAEMQAYRGVIRQNGDTDDTGVVKRAQQILGANPDGTITGTQPTFTMPILLWSAGLDGEFGASGGRNFDDVVLSEQVQ